MKPRQAGLFFSDWTPCCLQFRFDHETEASWTVLFQIELPAAFNSDLIMKPRQAGLFYSVKMDFFYKKYVNGLNMQMGQQPKSRKPVIAPAQPLLLIRRAASSSETLCSSRLLTRLKMAFTSSSHLQALRPAEKLCFGSFVAIELPKYFSWSCRHFDFCPFIRTCHELVQLLYLPIFLLSI
jgi:hypothetical protein